MKGDRPHLSRNPWRRLWRRHRLEWCWIGSYSFLAPLDSSIYRLLGRGQSACLASVHLLCYTACPSDGSIHLLLKGDSPASFCPTGGPHMLTILVGWASHPDEHSPVMLGIGSPYPTVFAGIQSRHPPASYWAMLICLPHQRHRLEWCRRGSRCHIPSGRQIPSSSQQRRTYPAGNHVPPGTQHNPMYE